MLIKFNKIVNKYGKPKGIIHIGAHLMEERSDYISQDLHNTIWIEANPCHYEVDELLECLALTMPVMTPKRLKL